MSGFQEVTYKMCSTYLGFNFTHKYYSSKEKFAMENRAAYWQSVGNIEQMFFSFLHLANTPAYLAPLSVLKTIVL
jgi:hypothetical protein